MDDMVWDGNKAENGISWKLHNESYPACPHECVGSYEKGTTIPDVSGSGVLHTCIPGKDKHGTDSPILNLAL